ncbi:hypothetical protein PInf_019334 [Phytophthora infestans]|nr:hypothetical protein PInf_019334 [Phytophthora infestans]
MLPLYRLATYYQIPARRPECWWLHCTLNELTLRLFFCRLTCLVIVTVIDILQDLNGEYFSFTTYAFIMGGLLGLAAQAYLSTHDPAVAIVATWCIVGLANTKVTFGGNAQETIEKLQVIAVAVTPLFPLMVFGDAFHFLLTNYGQVQCAMAGDLLRLRF